MLVRAAAEKPKPNQERMREFRDSALPSLEQQLFSTEPIYKNLETALLTDSLSEMQDALGKDNPDVQKVLQGKTPADAAKDLIANTKLDDVAVRKQLYEGGQAAIDASTDPLIVRCARSIRTPARPASSSKTRSTRWCGATARSSPRHASRRAASPSLRMRPSRFA